MVYCINYSQVLEFPIQLTIVLFILGMIMLDLQKAFDTVDHDMYVENGNLNR
jgi:hypothetical protein